MKVCKNLHIVFRNRGVYLLLGRNRKGIGLTWMPDHPLRVRIAVALLLAFMLVFALFWLGPLLKLFADFVCAALKLR
jgi:hypothetical protein